jgi:DNA adenine methylase
MSKNLQLPPLIKWPGGKGKIAIQTAKSFPKKYDTYVEPFAGGASVFFRIAPVKTMVLGDTDEWNIDFFNKVRKGGLDRCRGGVKVSRDLFDRSLKKKDACSKLIVASHSYHGNKERFFATPGKTGIAFRGKAKRRKDYEKKLRKTHLVVGSFEKVMKRFDKPSAVHYLDPPWPGLEGYSEQFYIGGNKTGRKKKKGNSKAGNRKAFDPAYVMAQASKMKGYVQVVYGDHPDVRAAYAKAKKCGWTIKRMKVGANNVRKVGQKTTYLVAIKKPGALKCQSLTSRKKK